MTYIYHILDCKGRPRYVGRTASVSDRWAAHLSLSRGGDRKRLYVWMNRCEQRNLGISVAVAIECDGDGIQEEKDEIKRLLRVNERLIFNITGRERPEPPPTFAIHIRVTPDFRKALTVWRGMQRPEIPNEAEALRSAMAAVLKKAGLL